MERGLGRRTLALCRVILGIIFLLFGEYKVVTPQFAHGGMQGWVQGFIDHSAYPFFKPVLQNFVMPHAVILGYFVGVAELMLGFSLVLGMFVGLSSIFGFIYMGLLALSTGYQADWPLWRYFGANLEHFCPALLFIIFRATHAGRTWGIDSFLARRYSSKKFLF
ncbi:MAG: DoxX family membrane protein [Acidobacteriia bacterium]|nr:DoxX family membrane protein [Terriglobia bacterium]